MRLSLLLHAAAINAAQEEVNQTNVRRNKISDILRRLSKDYELHIDEYKDRDFISLEVSDGSVTGANERGHGYMPGKEGGAHSTDQWRLKNSEGTLRWTKNDENLVCLLFTLQQKVQNKTVYKQEACDISDYQNTANWFVENHFFVKTVPILYNEIVGPCGSSIEESNGTVVPLKYFQSISDQEMQYGFVLEYILEQAADDEDCLEAKKKVFLRHKVPRASLSNLNEVKSHISDQCNKEGGGNLTDSEVFILREHCDGNVTVQGTGLNTFASLQLNQIRISRYRRWAVTINACAATRCFVPRVLYSIPSSNRQPVKRGHCCCCSSSFWR